MRKMAWKEYIKKANEASDEALRWHILMIVGTRPLAVDTGVEEPTDEQVVKAMAKEVLDLDVDFEKGRIIWGVPPYKVKGAEATLKPGSSFTMYSKDGIKVKEWTPVFDKVIIQELTDGIRDIASGGWWLDCGKASVYVTAQLSFKK